MQKGTKESRRAQKWAAVLSAAMLMLNAAEAAMLARWCAGISEDLAGQVSAAALVLNRLEDSRFPDTVSGVLAGAGYRHVRLRGDTPAQAAYAVRLAQMGIDPTGGAVFFRRTPRGAEFWG